MEILLKVLSHFAPAVCVLNKYTLHKPPNRLEISKNNNTNSKTLANKHKQK